MSVPFEVEELRDHYYLVRAGVDDTTAETRFFLDPAALDGLGLAGADPLEVVRVTAAFLLERQRIDDLPTQVEMEDVAAAYPDCVEALREQLGAAEG